MTLRVFSYGGGVQSTAALVLAAERRIDFPTFVFANVGDDSEHPATIAYVEQVAKPYAARHGITLDEVRYRRSDGATPTLLEYTRADTRSIRIPMHMAGGAPGNRTCTEQFKIKPIGRYLREHGARRATPAVIGLGISLDEIGRMRVGGEDGQIRRREYPLIDLRLRRIECLQIIDRASLPRPMKSSCWFCPFHNLRAWHDLRHDHPDLFDASVELEQQMIERRANLGKDAMYLTSKGRPLEQVIGDQAELFDYDGMYCESGYCEAQV